MTIQDLFQKYKPKEEFTILAKKSDITGKFFACIYRKGFIKNKYSKGNDSFESAEKVISEDDIEIFLRLILPYVEKRNNIPSDLAKFPRTPDEVLKKLPE